MRWRWTPLPNPPPRSSSDIERATAQQTPRHGQGARPRKGGLPIEWPRRKLTAARESITPVVGAAPRAAAVTAAGGGPRGLTAARSARWQLEARARVSGVAACNVSESGALSPTGGCRAGDRGTSTATPHPAHRSAATQGPSPPQRALDGGRAPTAPTADQAGDDGSVGAPSGRRRRRVSVRHPTFPLGSACEWGVGATPAGRPGSVYSQAPGYTALKGELDLRQLHARRRTGTPRRPLGRPRGLRWRRPCGSSDGEPLNVVLRGGRVWKRRVWPNESGRSGRRSGSLSGVRPPIHSKVPGPLAEPQCGAAAWPPQS